MTKNKMYARASHFAVKHIENAIVFVCRDDAMENNAVGGYKLLAIGVKQVHVFQQSVGANG